MKKNTLIITIVLVIVGGLTIYSQCDIENKIIDLLNFKNQTEIVIGKFIQFCV